MMKLCAGLALALCVAATPALARDHNGYSSEPNLTFSPRGASGIWDLGVDITQAGSTPANIRAFMAQQPQRVQEILYTTCQDRVAHPAFHEPSIVSFCRTLIGM
jgi:hypothetical protein